MLDDFVDSMTQADIERTCAEHLPRMLENLQLQRWRVRVFCKPLDGYNMWCSTLYNYLKATILIDPSKVESEEILLQKLQHELLHLVVAPIDPLYDAALRFAPCEASRKVAEDLYQYATERTIVNIEQMLTRCYSTTPRGVT